MLNKSGKKLRREQIDRTLAESGLRHVQPPHQGWIRDIRDALGMSAQQLANRMGVSQPTVTNMEQAEVAGTVTLGSLQRAASAMRCRLIYAIVPDESLEEVLRSRALEVAERVYARVEHTMALESQAGDPILRQRRVSELADDLVRRLSRDLWLEPQSGNHPRPGG